MQQPKQPKEQPIEPVSEEQAAEVSGGETACPTTVTAGTGGVTVQQTAPSPGDAFISIYDGAVDATSHIIERVSDALKNT
jgi:hypothetical protein